MNTRFQVGIAMVCIMLSGKMVLADDPIGNAQQGESAYRTYCLNCHGAKGRGDGPVADSLTPRPADLTSENVQKKSEKELLTIIRDGKLGTSKPSWKGEYLSSTYGMSWAYLRGFGR